MKNILKTLTFFLIFIFASSYCAQAQNSKEKSTYRVFKYGGFAGMYFANNATAMFYNGSDNYDNSIQEYFDQHELAWEQVEYILNRTVELGELPEKMKYNPNYCIGFHGAYFLNESNAISVDIGFTRLKASDVFRLDYTNLPADHLTEDTYYMAKIEGEEKRYQFDIGYQYLFSVEEQSNWYLEGGISMNNVEVISHKVQIEELEFDIKSDYTSSNNLDPDNNAPVYNVRQGKIGFGAYIIGGLEYRFNEALTLEPVVKVYYAQNRLPNLAGMHFHIVPSVRLTFKAMFEVIREE